MRPILARRTATEVVEKALFVHSRDMDASRDITVGGGHDRRRIRNQELNSCLHRR
jgi:hypothetical protein